MLRVFSAIARNLTKVRRVEELAKLLLANLKQTHHSSAVRAICEHGKTLNKSAPETRNNSGRPTSGWSKDQAVGWLR
jgi:hypothetical protein